MTLLTRLLVLLCTLSSFSQDLDLSALSIDPALKENADSVIREERTMLDITNPHVLDMHIYKAVSVYNKAGNADVQAYAYYDDDRKVKDIKATIYDVLGKEVKVFRQRDFRDVSAVSGGYIIC